MTAAVIVAMRIDAPPLVVFDAFTGDIGTWWVASPLFMLTPHGDGRLRFEPGLGGRLVSVLADGAAFEIGRIRVWQPGERLVLTWRQAGFTADQSTELEVRFEAVGAGTRVSITHRGWDSIPRDHAAWHGFDLVASQMRRAEHLRVALASMRARVASPL